jgi:hypothetical protein
MPSETPQEFPTPSGVAPNISHSLNPAGSRTQDVQPSGVPPIFLDNESINSANVSLQDASAPVIEVEHQTTADSVVSSVLTALNGYAGNGKTDDEDHLFHEHGLLVSSRRRNGDLREVCGLWAERIAPLVEARERQLGKPIHKGAPLYNTGLAFFLAGDFDSAMRYFAQADHEDVQNKGAHEFRLVAGDHPLSREIIIDPIMQSLSAFWVADYAKICGCNFDGQELINLLLALAYRPSDCLQAVVALHRIRACLDGPQNQATLVIRFRALADLLHLIESFLRQFQQVKGQLRAHVAFLLQANRRSETAYKGFGTALGHWTKTTGNDGDSPSALDWISSETSNRLVVAPDSGTAAGIVAFFCHKYRNSLLHVNEEALIVFNNQEDCLAAAGYVLSMLRICLYAKDGTFGKL